MIDHCIHCTARGDLKACQSKECANHRNWYAVALSVEAAKLRRRACWLELLAAVLIGVLLGSVLALAT